MDSLLVYSSSQCSDTSILIVNVTTGISEIDKSDNVISLYPNPAINQVNIKITGVGSFTSGLCDFTGRLVMPLLANKPAGIYTISTKDLPAGIYLVRTIGSEGKTHLSKLVLVK